MNATECELDLQRIPLQGNGPGRTLLLASLALLALGVVMVHSALASVAEPGAWYQRVDIRHTLFAGVAMLILAGAWRIDYRLLARGRRVTPAAVLLLLALACSLLVYVPGVGHQVGSASRWLRFGPREYSIGFQPSELLKLSLVIFLAVWLSRTPIQDIRNLKRTFVPAACLIAICLLLVIKQDFGSAILMGVSAATVLLLAGVPLWQLSLLIPPGAGAFWLLVVRSEHRWARITAMLDPWVTSDPGTYQPRNSLLAILNGGVSGRGVGNGMYKLGFLPEDSTDFIFSVYCEEWGLIGALLLMGLIAVWLISARRAAGLGANRLGRLLAGGLGFMIGIQAVLHLAVDLVVAPPTGMGLPFVSAGGTALWVMAGAAAVIVSVSARRPTEEPFVGAEHG